MRNVAAPPSKPLLIYDGDCNFCKHWIARWKKWTGDAVDYLPSQDAKIAVRFPEIPRAEFDKSVQLIEPDGKVFSGAEAVFRSLAKNPNHRRSLRFYYQSRFFAWFTECGYRLVAQHRGFFSWLSGTHL